MGFNDHTNTCTVKRAHVKELF